MNERRHRALTRLARCGSEIRVLDHLFGPERDAVIRNSKLVLNLSYYEKGAFEQVRAFHCLSLGTPMLSVTSGNTSNVPAAFRQSVFWRGEQEACDFLQSEFKTEAFYSEAQLMLSSYRRAPHETLAAEQQQLRQLLATVGSAAPQEARHQSRSIYLGSGHAYRPGWINIDVDRATYPDLVLDLCDEIELPILAHSPYLGAIKIAENSIDKILADNVLERVSDLPRLMTNCLRILVLGGQMEIIVPYERSQAAWQDPTHVRAFNERSWLYYAEWCWRLGWFHHYFKLQSFAYLDVRAKSVLKDSSDAFFMRVVMTKEQTTPKDRNRYRLQRSDFGPGLDDDGDVS
jgi:SAM-dependent methyltransferase